MAYISPNQEEPPNMQSASELMSDQSQQSQPEHESEETDDEAMSFYRDSGGEKLHNQDVAKHPDQELANNDYQIEKPITYIMEKRTKVIPMHKQDPHTHDDHDNSWHLSHEEVEGPCHAWNNNREDAPSPMRDINNSDDGSVPKENDKQVTPQYHFDNMALVKPQQANCQPRANAEHIERMCAIKA